MSEVLGSAILELRADGSGLDRDMDTAEAGASKRMGRLGKGMALTGAGLTAALTLPIKNFAGMAAEELESIEQANNGTARSLKRMGSDSLVSVAGVQKLAGELQQLSGQDDQLVQMGQNAILTFGGINTATKEGAATFEHASRVMVDFAEASNTSVDAAGKQIAKTMAAASQGVLLLPRGLKLTGEEQARLERVMKSGASAAQKQAAVMEVLGKKVEGAANLTNAEKWAVLKDRLAGVGAQLLTRLLPLGDKLIGFLTTVMGHFEKLSPRMQTVAAVGLVLAAAIGPILLGLGGLLMVVPAVGAALGALSLPVVAVVAAIGAAIGVLIVAYRESEAFRTIVQKVGSVLRQVGAVVLPLVVAALKQFASDVIRGIDLASRFALMLAGAVRSALVWIRDHAAATWSAVNGAIDRARDFAVGLGAVLSGAVKTGMSWVRDNAAAAWSAVNSAIDKARDTAAALGSSLTGAVQSGLVWIRDKAASAWSPFETAAGKIRDVVQAIASAVSSIISGLSTVASKISSLPDMPNLSSLPGMARGGITKGLTLAGEAGPEAAVIPLGSSSRERSDRARVMAQAGLNGGGSGAGVVQKFYVTNPVEEMSAFMRRARTEARWVGTR